MEMKDAIFNMEICGVGGQGILYTSILIGKAAIMNRLKVKISPIYEMAQRSASIMSDIRISNRPIFCSEIPSGSVVHTILGFEPYEVLRVYRNISKRTTVILNTEKIPFTSRGFQYPSLSKILRIIKKLSSDVVELNASETSQQEGIQPRMNMIVLGFFTAKKGLFTLDTILKVVRESEHGTPENIKAIRKGYDLFHES